MVELAVEQDEEAMEAYLEGNEPDIDTLRKLIRKGTLDMAFVPVLGGSAFKNKGVQPMLNAVLDYLPSPLDVPAYKGFKPGDETETRDIERSASDDEPFSGLAFQNLERSICWVFDLRAYLLRCAHQGRFCTERHKR